MVGDFGWTFNMTNTQKNFDAINSYVGNLTAQGGQIDFFMTMGDNLYIADEKYPTQEDIDTMMSVFQKSNIKDILIYAVRGNHDCTAVDPYFEVNITKRYPAWRMPELYYSRTFDIGNGKKMGTIFVDTCLALCSNFTYADGSGG
jgi:tartrate-resistant acid phosphatase type 5